MADLAALSTIPERVGFWHEVAVGARNECSRLLPELKLAHDDPGFKERHETGHLMRPS